MLTKNGRLTNGKSRCECGEKVAHIEEDDGRVRCYCEKCWMEKSARITDSA